MSCKNESPWPRHTWCPQDHKGVDHYQFGLYLKEKMGPEWGAWWLKEMDRLVGRTQFLDTDSTNRLIQQICKYDSAEMAELMYPLAPELFRTPLSYPFREGTLNALARCAELGSVACLETLLELGVDPDGLDSGGEHNRMPVDCEEDQFVTPLDCALAADQEECRFLLELYGGRSGLEVYRQLAEEVVPC